MTPYEVFRSRHCDINRYLWSSILASQLLYYIQTEDDYILNTDLNEYLRARFPKAVRKNSDIKKYLQYRAIDNPPDRPPIVATLLDDLRDNRPYIYETVILSETRALEIYIRQIVHEFAEAVRLGQNSDPEFVATVQRKADKIEANPRAALRLVDLYDLFPAIREIAKSTTRMKSVTPLLSLPGMLSCHDAIELWREIRNLFAHHDGVVYEAFSTTHSEQYFLLGDREGKPHGAIPVGARLWIHLRHATYCLTTCAQMARLLDQSVRSKS